MLSLKWIVSIRYIDLMNINTLDLNLLKVFDALYLERNVSRAGERIGIAQSSMSNALNRLRDQFDDPLFQRTPKGMEPTARAEELAPQVQLVLMNVSQMLAPQQFDPAQADERISIAAPDLVVMTLAPELMQQLARLAPGIQLNFVPVEKQQVFNRLDDGSLKLAIGTFANVPAHLRRKSFSQEQFVCIARNHHKDIKQRLTLNLYCRLPHILMTLNADQVGVIDAELKKLGKQRHIAMTCAQFSPIAEIVANSDLIATVPNSLASVAERAGCCVYPLPFEVERWEMELISSQKFYSDPLGKFISELILQCQKNA